MATPWTEGCPYLPICRCVIGQTLPVAFSGPFPFKGEVVWLTPEQGGRRTGPPVDPDNYAQVAHVTPHGVHDGSASFVLSGFEPGAPRSSAQGRWLIVENEGPQLVEPGSIVVVTEGPQVVAFFTVSEVTA